MTPEDLRSLDGQRTIQIDRHIRRQPSIFGQKIQAIHHFLGSLHGEGRDNHLLFVAITIGYGLCQFVQAVILILMIAVAVR